MSEKKICWNNDLLYHSKYFFKKDINVLDDFQTREGKIREKLKNLLVSNDLIQFNGSTLLFEGQETDPSGFATPFLNIINISKNVFNSNNNDDLLWLILHEYIHILEAKIISNVNIQINQKLNYFNNIVYYWLEHPVSYEIEITENVLDIVNLYVYDYKTIAIDWEHKFGYSFRDKYGDLEYTPKDLIQTYSNLLRDDGELSVIPDSDEGLAYLLDAFIRYINHCSKKLGSEDISDARSKIISAFLLNWTLYKLYLECIRNTRDPYSVLSEARAIYFSSILVNKKIDDFQKKFPIDDCKIYEANRLLNVYGSKFKLENVRMTIENERLSNEAREMAFRSSFGYE